MNNRNYSEVDYHEVDLVNYFQTFYLGFERAVKVVDSTDSFYNLGGATIRVRFAGSALIPQLTPALAHLKTEPVEQPDLTICAWDSASTGVKLPLMASSLLDLLRFDCWNRLDTRMEIKGYDSERFQSMFHLGSNLFNVLDVKENLALYWTDDADNMPYWERSSPFRNLLDWWMSHRDLQYVHAGAVGNKDGGILLVGKSGSGKSSTALACLKSDLFYTGDDYCLVGTKPEPCVYSLYNTAKLKGQEDLERFPHLEPFISNRDRIFDEKAMIFINQHFPEKIVDKLPIKAILVPTVTGKPDTRVKKASAIVALKALAPSTILQLPKTGESALERMTELVKQVPCYILELGTDIPQIPQTISKLLSEL